MKATTVIESVLHLRVVIRKWREQQFKIGFVPTMGNLHAGHIKLVETAQQHCDKVIVSIFVNPMQFGPNEDFDRYPRTFQADYEKLSIQNADAVFVPCANEIYPHGLTQQTFVEVPELSNELCGAVRPGHFRGVCTVVTKLFNLVQPDMAFLGEKDYQQLAVIKQMTADLCLPIDIVGVATVREKDGLALSSRNQYLTPEQRENNVIYPLLCEVRDEIIAGERDYLSLCEKANEQLIAAGFKPDYFSICRQHDLKPATAEDKKLVILTAAYLGKTRLIDNVAFEL